MSDKPFDADKAVSDYVKLGDFLTEKKKEWAAEEKRIKDVQQKIQTALLKHLNDTKQESARTKSGTFFKQEKLTPTAADWDTFYKWIAENDAFEFLQKRIKSTEVSAYMEQHEGTPPPGVSVYREYEVHVRRGK
jgi:hypothetical protein